MTKPKYCPNCAKPLGDIQPCWGEEWEYEGERFANTVYDCYCSACDWSGDISPDDEIDIPKEEAPKSDRHTQRE